MQQSEVKSVIKDNVRSPWYYAFWFRIYLSDKTYTELSYDDLSQAWSEYIANHVFAEYVEDEWDCENESIEALAWLQKRLKNTPIGEAWSRSHSFLVAVADGGLWVLDPLSRNMMEYQTAIIVWPAFSLKRGRFVRV